MSEIGRALAAIHAHAGQAAVALGQAEDGRTVNIVETGAGRAELKLHRWS